MSNKSSSSSSSGGVGLASLLTVLYGRITQLCTYN